MNVSTPVGRSRRARLLLLAASTVLAASLTTPANAADNRIG